MHIIPSFDTLSSFFYESFQTSLRSALSFYALSFSSVFLDPRKIQAKMAMMMDITPEKVRENHGS
jgi:hypothetical protein